MNNKLLVGFIILIAVVGGGYYIKKSMAPAVQQQDMQPTSSVAVPVSEGSSLSQQLTVTGTEFAFMPSIITVKQGKQVSLTFKNEGKYPHNITLSDINVQSKTIKAGEQDTVTFTPTKTGSFTYTCTVQGHADKGMKGTLIVE